MALNQDVHFHALNRCITIEATRKTIGSLAIKIKLIIFRVSLYPPISTALTVELLPELLRLIVWDFMFST
jgi:hypothetical protein